MRAVRIWFQKSGNARYISHLDLTRYLTRIFRKTDIKPWYTEGFNPRLHMVFGLSLALGVEGKNECFDIKLISDETDKELLCKLMTVSTEDIRFLAVTEPVYTPLDIAFAEYTVTVSDCSKELEEYIRNSLTSDTLIATKTSKKGSQKEINLIDFIRNLSFSACGDGFSFTFVLPAGNEGNISPLLLLSALFEESDYDYRVALVSRNKLLLSNMENYS